MSIEQYQPRGPEVTACDGRFAVLFIPDVNPAVDNMFVVKQDGETFFARVDGVLGSGKVRVDFLGNAPKQGPVKVESTSWKPKFETAGSASQSQWSVMGKKWRVDDSPSEAKNVQEIKKRLNACAPFVQGGLNIAFMEKRLEPKFFGPPNICSDQPGVGFFDDAKCGWEVFSKSLEIGADALIYCTYSNDFEQRLAQFRDNGGTRFFIVEVPNDIFPIIESFSVGDPDTVWVVDDFGRVNLMRSSSKFEGEGASKFRSEMANAEEAFEFALLSGDSVDQVVTVWTQPVFKL